MFDSAYGNAGYFRTSKELGSATYWGQLTTYKGGGFVQDFGTDLTTNLNIISHNSLLVVDAICCRATALTLLW